MTGVSVDIGRGGGGGGGDRFPQWSVEETRELLMGRAELDTNFMETKRNKFLWEMISNRMREKGYNRSSDQCKSKWKNLVTRYKGYETTEDESKRQRCPFHDELQSIFGARMLRIEDGNEDSEGEIKGSAKKKRKIKTGSSDSSTTSNNVKILREILEEYMKQQVQMEVQWMKAYEAREKERRVKEMEWRQTMEALENERIMMEKRWREREEERRVREEARAERRDALITALLNKLRREDHNN
ncbi:hypothetical protein LguiA_032075 [Lonicera macranthoides]